MTIMAWDLLAIANILVFEVFQLQTVIYFDISSVSFLASLHVKYHLQSLNADKVSFGCFSVRTFSCVSAPKIEQSKAKSSRNFWNGLMPSLFEFNSLSPGYLIREPRSMAWTHPNNLQCGWTLWREWNKIIIQQLLKAILDPFVLWISPCKVQHPLTCLRRQFQSKNKFRLDVIKGPQVTIYRANDRKIQHDI